MQPIKNTQEERLLHRLKTNCFSRKRNPSPIRLFTLTKGLIKVNKHKLAKEMAHVLTTNLSYRLMSDERYMLAFNSLALKDWNNIAVIQLSKKLNKFNSIVCVDLKEYNNEFRQTQTVFMKLLLNELLIIIRG